MKSKSGNFVYKPVATTAPIRIPEESVERMLLEEINTLVNETSPSDWLLNTGGAIVNFNFVWPIKKKIKFSIKFKN